MSERSEISRRQRALARAEQVYFEAAAFPEDWDVGLDYDDDGVQVFVETGEIPDIIDAALIDEYDGITYRTSSAAGAQLVAAHRAWVTLQEVDPTFWRGLTVADEP